MDKVVNIPDSGRYWFIECKKLMLDLLVEERKSLQGQLDEAMRHKDGITSSKLIGKIELIRDLEQKICALESSSLLSH